MKVLVAIAAAALVGLAAFSSSLGTIQVRAAQQSPMCLHGDDESAGQLARRQRALGFARRAQTEHVRTVVCVFRRRRGRSVQVRLFQRCPGEHLPRRSDSRRTSLIE